MKDPRTSRLFEERVDSESGVKYYVLKEKVATYQQGFYFCNDSMTKDGRYLWFYACFPPVYSEAARHLGYVDFETDEIVLCHDTLFTSASPYIDTETGEAYFTWENGIYRRAPGKDERSEKIVTLKFDGATHRLATHMTRSSDKKYFYLDCQVGTKRCYIGKVNIENGDFDKWLSTDYHINHAQINPKDDNLLLCARDYFTNTDTGEFYTIPFDENGNYLRLWTVTPDGKMVNYPARNDFATHEFWGSDGRKIYYVNFNGIQCIELDTDKHYCVHECDVWHAFATKDERYFAYDEALVAPGEDHWRGCPTAVHFYDRTTGKDIKIVSYQPSNGFSPQKPNIYHIDPHPRFVANDKYVVFTTTVLGSVDVALAFTEDLKELTK